MWMCMGGSEWEVGRRIDPGWVGKYTMMLRSTGKLLEKKGVTIYESFRYMII